MSNRQSKKVSKLLASTVGAVEGPLNRDETTASLSSLSKRSSKSTPSDPESGMDKARQVLKDEPTAGNLSKRRLSKPPADPTRLAADSPSTKEEAPGRNQSRQSSKLPRLISEAGLDEQSQPIEQEKLSESQAEISSEDPAGVEALDVGTRMVKDEITAKSQSKKLSKPPILDPRPGTDVVSQARSQSIKEESIQGSQSKKTRRSATENVLRSGTGFLDSPNKELSKLSQSRDVGRASMESRADIAVDSSVKGKRKISEKKLSETILKDNVTVENVGQRLIQDGAKRLSELEGLAVQVKSGSDSESPSPVTIGRSEPEVQRKILPEADILSAALTRVDRQSSRDTASTSRQSEKLHKGLADAGAAIVEGEISVSKERLSMSTLKKHPSKTPVHTKNPDSKASIQPSTKDENDSHKPKKLSKATAEIDTLGNGSSDSQVIHSQSAEFVKEATRSPSKKLKKTSGEHGTVGSHEHSLVHSEKDETRNGSKVLSKPPLGGSVSVQSIRKKRETMKSLLVSADILPEEQDIREEEFYQEPLPKPGNSHFKFLKSRCGKLVDPKTWVPSWQGYNALETENSWNPVDEWAPTRQFMRYEENLVVWRHDPPLAQHIGWNRGCWAKYYKRPVTSSSWDY